MVSNLVALSETFTSVQPAFGSRNLEHDGKLPGHQQRAKLAFEQTDSFVIDAPREDEMNSSSLKQTDVVIENPVVGMEMNIGGLIDSVDGRELILSNLWIL